MKLWLLLMVRKLSPVSLYSNNTVYSGKGDKLLNNKTVFCHLVNVATLKGTKIVDTPVKENARANDGAGGGGIVYL